jgi:hypothetical protein
VGEDLVGGGGLGLMVVRFDIVGFWVLGVLGNVGKRVYVVCVDK